MNILLICGHGAGDPGACACGYKEADLVREYAPTLKKALSPYAKVDLFDTSKNMYKLLKSGKSFDFTKYDYVFELHFNAAAGDTKGNGVTTGSEILVHNTEKGTTVEQAILKNICALGFKNRGVKTRSNLQNMNICKKKQKVSYALLETCFIDDADDMKLYQAKKNEVVKAIADGMISGFNMKAPAKKEAPKLESANDITYELRTKYITIHEIDNFVKALDEAKKSNSPLYWGYYKLVNKIE